MYIDPTGHTTMEEAILLTQQLTSYRLNESKSDKTIEQKLNDIQKIYTRNDANFKDSDAYKDLQKIQNSGSTSDYLAAEAIAALNENERSSFIVDERKGTNNFNKYINYENAEMNMNFNTETYKISCEQGGFKAVVALPSELFSEKDNHLSEISNQSKIALLLDTNDWFNAKSQAERDEILKGLDKVRYAIKKDKLNEAINYELGGFLENCTGGLLNGLTKKSDVDDLQNSLKISALGCFIGATLKASGPDKVRVFRVEGKVNERITIGENGEVAIEGNGKVLYLNFGKEDRAIKFLAQRIEGGMTDATIKSFEVHKSYLDKIRDTAVNQSEAKQFPNRPFICDPTKADDQFGIRPEQIDGLTKEIIEGSGKIIEP